LFIVDGRGGKRGAGVHSSPKDERIDDDTVVKRWKERGKREARKWPQMPPSFFFNSLGRASKKKIPFIHYLGHGVVEKNCSRKKASKI